MSPLFDDEIRARRLFLEISDRKGITGAKRIFNETVKAAAKQVAKARPTRKPPPKKRKGSHSPLRDLQLRTIWDGMEQAKTAQARQLSRGGLRHRRGIKNLGLMRRARLDQATSL
jgi:hypothetical protein